eukprot:75247_1
MSLKLEGAEAMLCISGCLGCVLDIIILFIGFMNMIFDFPECNNQGDIMDMHSFAIMAGFIGIAISIVNIFLLLCICNKRIAQSLGRDDVYAKIERLQSILLLTNSLIFCAISIIGFLNFSACTVNCQSSSLGQVIL